MHTNDCVSDEVAQHSILQTQAAARVVRHHFAEQVPVVGERVVSAGRGSAGREGAGKGKLTFA